MPTVWNPSLDGEDLARGWGLGEWQSFRRAVIDAAGAAREARDTEDEEEAVGIWNGEALFDGRFPTTVRGLGAAARSTAAALASGSLYADLGSGRRSAVPSNRGFYGRRA